ncbi:GNAT family N-acetyltransferase [Macrococcus equipercicus]|uniref:GNAT family N-acetyltransferase n=1 Tax=Macrococcus equipercicus TaxID=69967 RepID=A0A9Q9F3F1_9STAP|nr:GNAT family N-acetyltransferase [Macrococcus equipercicus]UTH13919.1 GNAT family N-acetyltransferase [Macrococcus equipercicus]
MIIKRAEPTDQAGILNHLAIGEMCEAMFGTTDRLQLIKYMQKLYEQPGNRFSHEYTWVAEENGVAAGAVTVMPANMLRRTTLMTVWHIMRLKKLRIIPQLFNYPKHITALLRLDEAERNECHISMIAVLPEFQGVGLGTLLLKAAEDYAAANGHNICSLTVKQNNYGAQKLYKTVGYEIAGVINQPPFRLYKMRKYLNG